MKTRMLGLPNGEKNVDDMYNRLDRIPACDRQTEGQTSCHGIVRAMHTFRAVIKPSVTLGSMCILIHVPYSTPFKVFFSPW